MIVILTIILGMFLVAMVAAYCVVAKANGEIRACVWELEGKLADVQVELEQSEQMLERERSLEVKVERPLPQGYGDAVGGHRQQRIAMALSGVLDNELVKVEGDTFTVTFKKIDNDEVS